MRGSCYSCSVNTAHIITNTRWKTLANTKFVSTSWQKLEDFPDLWIRVSPRPREMIQLADEAGSWKLNIFFSRLSKHGGVFFVCFFFFGSLFFSFFCFFLLVLGGLKSGWWHASADGNVSQFTALIQTEISQNNRWMDWREILCRRSCSPEDESDWLVIL